MEFFFKTSVGTLIRTSDLANHNYAKLYLQQYSDTFYYILEWRTTLTSTSTSYV